MLIYFIGKNVSETKNTIYKNVERSPNYRMFSTTSSNDTIYFYFSYFLFFGNQIGNLSY